MFNEDSLQRRGFVVLPMLGIWVPSEDPIVSVLKTRGCERLFAKGFLYEEELYLCSEIDARSLGELLDDFLEFCLIAPRGERLSHVAYEFRLLVFGGISVFGGGDDRHIYRGWFLQVC